MTAGFLVLAIGFAVLAYALQKVMRHVRTWRRGVEAVIGYAQHVAIAAAVVSWIACFSMAAREYFR